MVSEVKLKKKRLPRPIPKNLDYLSFLLLLFGFFLSLVGFWETETVLWNRIKYTTGSGSQWSSANPIYLNTPLSQLILLLIRNIIYYIIGNFLILIISAVTFYKYILKKSWFKTSKIFLGVLGISSLLASSMGFWLRYSLTVLETLPSRDGTISGYEWIREVIGIQSTIIESFSFTFMISSLITLSITIYIIFRKLYQKRRNTSEINVVLERADELI